MQYSLTIYLSFIWFSNTISTDQVCKDRHSGRTFRPWQEWSDHYLCHGYRCEIRDGDFTITSFGCRKPKIPENAVQCQEYIEDENVEYPICCARLRCAVDVDGTQFLHIRGQPNEIFHDKPLTEAIEDSAEDLSWARMAVRN